MKIENIIERLKGAEFGTKNRAERWLLLADLERQIGYLVEKRVELPMGVSQWREYGKKFGYWDYFKKEKEICICAAIKFETPSGQRIIRGHRHGDCFANRAGRPDRKDWKEIEQGFMTGKNRFVGREEGRKLMNEVSWKSVDLDGYRGNTLFSEDLY